MSPSSPRPHGHGTLLGRYVIRERLGTGSLGAVYKVWDEVSERLLALKVLRTEQALGEASSRMEEEFRAIASLRHPQIARAYDFGFTDDGRVPFFTREYVPGRPLSSGLGVNDSAEEFLRPIVD
ncbi:MAG: hypothetical protein AAF517_10870, partial [Planctomycetota bacterium]